MPSAQSYYQQVRKRQEVVAVLALPLFIIGIIGSRFYIPMGIMFYLALWSYSYHIQDQMHPRWSLVQGGREAFRHPPVGFSGEPDPANKGLSAIYPPNRVASINAAIIAILWSLLIPQALPVLSGIGIYMTIVAIAQAKRLSGYKDTPYPATLCSKAEIVDTITSDQSHLIISSMAILWAGGLAAGLLYLIERFGQLWKPTLIQIKYAHYAHIDLTHFHIGYSSIPIFIAVGLVAGLCAAWWTICYFLQQASRAPWLKQQDTSQQWGARWEAIGKIPDIPLYRGEVNKPNDTNPTHTIIVFQTPSGTDFSQFEGFADKLASSLQPDIVLISPLPMQDDMGMAIPGTAQTLGFKVTYATGPMGDCPWMQPNYDEETLGFVFQWAIKNVLRGMKLPSPIWAYNRILYNNKTRRNHIIVETQWKLPPSLTYEALTKRIGPLQEKLEVPWLRIGKRPQTPFISIVYGINPMDIRSELENTIDPTTLQFLDAINWDYILRTCKIQNQEGQVPPYIQTQSAHHGLKIHSFGAISGLPMTTIQAAKNSLIPTIGARFVDIEPSDEVGGFKIITGDQDPLDRLYKFADYLDDPTDPLIKLPAEEPEIEFKIGVGSDGKVLNFAHDNESPHLVIAGASGQGKLQDCNLIIQLTDGTTTTMGNLKVGDEIFDNHGLPTKVTHTYPIQTPNECFEITLDQGEKIRASSDHRWLTEDATYRTTLSQQPSTTQHKTQNNHIDHPTAIINNLQLLLESRPDISFTNKQNRNPTSVFNKDGQEIINHLPISDWTPDRDTLIQSIHPYLMGLWLASAKNPHQFRICSNDPNIGEYLQRLGGCATTAIPSSVKNPTRFWWTVADIGQIFDAVGLLDSPQLPLWYIEEATSSQCLMLLRGVVDVMGPKAMIPEELASALTKMLGRIGIEPDSNSDFVSFSGLDLPRPENAPKAPPIGPHTLGVWISTASPDRQDLFVSDSRALDRLLEEGTLPEALPSDNPDQAPRFRLVGVSHVLKTLELLENPVLPDWISDEAEEYRRRVLEGALLSSGTFDRLLGVYTIKVNRENQAKALSRLVSSLNGSAIRITRDYQCWQLSFASTAQFAVASSLQCVPARSGQDYYAHDGRLLTNVWDLIGEMGAYQSVIWKLVDAMQGIRIRHVARQGDEVFATVSNILYPRTELVSRLMGHLAQQMLWAARPAPRVVNTGEIFDTLYADDAGRVVNHAIRKAPALQYPWTGEVLPIDPYVLGVWLGGDDSHRGALCGVGQGAFCEAGLLYGGCVPVEYLRASHEDRLALLQGLMDVGGSCNRLDGVCEFVHSDERVVEGVYRLVRSLGVKASMVEGVSVRGSRRVAWCVHFVTDLSVFRLFRKLVCLPVSLRGVDEYHYVVRCERVESIPMRCIEVDSSDHMYLVGEFLVATHNSNLIHSMVLQMATKNTPEQWELRIAEPKNELQRYKGLPHVTRFVDMHTPANNHYEPVKDMLEELYEEMERRYTLFLHLPTRPHKLEQALRDPALQETLPYITCLIEECADYFAKPDDAAERKDYQKLIYYLNWLVRKARGAGIYMVAATQRPSKENIPTQVKANSRRIGLGTNTMVDSQIIIDQPGLEEIRTKGRGMVSSYGGYRGFRAFYFDEKPGDYNSLSRFLEPLELLSGYRTLGATAVHSVKYPIGEGHGGE